MATKTLIKTKKNARRVPKQSAATSRRPTPRRVSTTDEEMLGSRQVAAAPAESSTVFDPRLILTRLVGGKSTQEYQSGESVFAQGDTAEAVFYIQSGKAKMTWIGFGYWTLYSNVMRTLRLGSSIPGTSLAECESSE